MPFRQYLFEFTDRVVQYYLKYRSSRKPKGEEGDKPNKTMRRETVLEVISLLSQLDHIPFAVCGLAAMVYHGFEGEHARRVSILCPASAEHIINCWARAKNMYSSPDDPSTLGIKTSDGVIRRVRIEFLESGFESWSREAVPGTHSYVLDLASIANDIAQGYVHELEKYHGEHQAAYRRCMAWTLREMRARGLSITPENAPDIYRSEFWEPFTLSFSELIPLFRGAGVDIDESGVPRRGSRCVADSDATSPPIPQKTPRRLSRKPGMIFRKHSISWEGSAVSESASNESASNERAALWKNPGDRSVQPSLKRASCLSRSSLV